MIIDFHAHIFPAKIAEKASKSIGDFYSFPMEYNGTVEQLLSSGSKIGVDYYIVHSTATKAAQVEAINNFIIEEAGKHPEFIGFGSIHPDYENFENELKRIKTEGLKGIKLHADFQNFQMDDEKMDPVYEVMSSLNMPVLVHAGDYRYDFSGPKRILNVINKHPKLRLVAAHFGGYTEWNNSEEFLVGKNVYFDTSSTLWKLPIDKALEMISKHGVEKFFFGSDYPMWDHEQELERFNKLNLSQNDKDAILYKNACEFLNLSTR